jgi:hypothetical protein
MSLLNGNVARTEKDRESDLMLSGVAGLVSTGFAARAIDVIQTKPPEWGAVASLTGCMAMTLAGVAAHRWSLAFNATSSGAEQPSPPAEK